ncbi:hypothetical protein [Bradyrhizobium sp. 18]|uniref:hypothetical protein n=1 Tax=Bradyrhizobium sp. 18 TaxID=2782657 RepID=UPI001FFB070B|nr:hypothetical protein [Bradyrhizobium sp. 18]MCK1503844.1 hypothetical protein [Bradyrhizobium sp. 18]
MLPMPFDPSIAAEFERVALLNPPIIERVQAAEIGSDYFLAMVPTWAAQIDEDVDRRLAALREGSRSLFDSRKDAPPQEHAVAVEHFERSLSENVAGLLRTIDRFSSRFNRAAKKNAKLERVRPDVERIVAAGHREIEAKIDEVMSFRAARADIDPASRGGPAFDNAEDLGSYLRRVLT